jgi:uncharacterized protein YrrD
MRDNALHYERGAHVRTFEGREVGTIDRIVFDPKAQRVTHIVVRKGILLTTDRVIPVADLESVEDGVMISEGTDPKDFRRFEQSDYVYDRHSDFYVANPAVAVGAMGPIGAPDTELKRHRERNLPDDSIALQANSEVISSDGQKVGRVKEIVTNPDDDRTIQLVVASGLGDRTKRVLPANLVISISEDEIHLSIDSNEADEYVITD